MSRFSPASKQNPCRVCGGTSSYCKTKLDNDTLYNLCPKTNANLGDRIDNLICVKGNRGSDWATFTEDTRQKWTDEQRQQYRINLDERERNRKRDEAERAKLSLSADERHEEYSKILDSLSLNDIDRQDLINRGFTHEQIVKGRFKSWERGQKFGFPVNPLLPGVGFDGSSFFTSGDGYLCPILDPQGRITGLQLRLRVPIDNNRYRWISGGQRQILALYPQNENPIAVFRPSGEAVGFALVEGTGAKPFLTSERLELITIGASGGQFLSSSQLLKEYLETLVAESGLPKKISLYPDAGDVCNISGKTGQQQIVERWRKTSELVESWGWEVNFGWWGQLTKASSDVDELTSEEIQEIKYVTPDEFFEIAKNAKRQEAKEEEERAEQAQITAENAIYRELTAINPLKLEAAGIKLSYIDKPELDACDLKLEKNKISIVISAKATGKSNAAAVGLSPFDSVYSWHNRISLARAMAYILSLSGKSPTIYKNDTTNYGTNKRVTFCANSGYHFTPANLCKNGALLVDEADQLFRYLFENLCNKDGIRPVILASLESHLTSALHDGSALLASADISQKDIDYIVDIAPKGTKIEVIVNTHKPKRCPLYFSTDNSPDGLIEVLMDKLNEGIPCFVLDDLKNGVKGCKSIAEFIRREWRAEGHDEWCDEILEINSDTSSEETVKIALANINEKSLKYRLIICSPSVTSGLSITNGRFADGVFGFFQGILLDVDAGQGLGRIRGAKSVYVFAAKKGINTENSGCITPIEVNNFYKRNYDNRNRFILEYLPQYNPMTDEWESPHWNLFCKNAAYQNLVMARLRMRIKDKLIDDGYEIIETEFGKSEEVKDCLNNAWWSIQKDEALEIADSKLLNKDEVKELQLKQQELGLTRKEKHCLIKTHIFNTFGEKFIESAEYEHKDGTQLFGYAAVALMNYNGKLERGLFNLYRINRPIEDSYIRDLQQEQAQEQYSDTSKRFPGDLRWDTRRFKFWEHYQIKDFLQPEKEWYPSQYKNLVDNLKASPITTKDVVGFNPEKIGAGQIFDSLISSVGLTCETVEVEINGQKQKWKARKITQQSWDLSLLFIEHRETLRLERLEQDTKWQEKCKQEQEAMKARQQETAIERGAEAIKKKFEKHCYDKTVVNVDSLKECVEFLKDCEDAEMLDILITGWQSLFREKSKLIDFLLELASKFLPGKEIEIKDWIVQEESEQLELIKI